MRALIATETPLITFLVVLLAGCGAVTDETDGSSVGGPPDAVSVEAALTAPEGERLRVRGSLFRDGSGPWRLCESLAESMPPRCGEPAADLVGYDPGTFPPEGGRAGGIQWLDRYEVIVHRDGESLVVEDE